MKERPVGNRGEVLRVGLNEYRGRHSVDIRRWYPAENDELRPGKGVSVPVHMVPWLRAAIVELERDALRRGLIVEQDYELAGLPIAPELLGEGRVTLVEHGGGS